MENNHENKSKWLVLISMAICLSLIFIDQTAVPITLQILRRQMNANFSQIQWVLNAYILTLTSLIMIGGKLADLLGHRKIFYFGCVIFCIGSQICGLSEHIDILLIGRGTQGIGAAFMLPASGVLLMNAFQIEERGMAMGIYIASASLFLALGPFIGGVITQHLSWRWVYLINMPLLLISISILFTAKVKEYKENIQFSDIDWVGFVLLFLSIVPAVYTLMEITKNGLISVVTLSLMFLSLAAFYLFLRNERRNKLPLININVFKDNAFIASAILIIIVQISIIALSFWPMILVNIFDLTSQQTGIALLFATTPIMLVSPIAGKLMDQSGPKLPMILGFICIVLGALFSTIMMWTQQYSLLMLSFFLYGCGPSFMVGTLMTHILNSVQPQNRGTVAGITTFIRQIGGTLGITVISLMMNNLTKLKTVAIFSLINEYTLISDANKLSSVIAYSCLSLMLVILFLGCAGLLRTMSTVKTQTFTKTETQGI